MVRHKCQLCEMYKTCVFTGKAVFSWKKARCLRQRAEEKVMQ